MTEISIPPESLNSVSDSSVAETSSEFVISSTDEAVRFNFNDYIAPFHTRLKSIFKAPAKEGILLYRSFISWYPCDDDHTPLRLRDRPGRKIKPAFTYEQVEAMDQDKMQKELKHLALSCNESEEDARKSLEAKLAVLRKKEVSEEEIEESMTQRGLYIAPILMKPEHGLITDFYEGHNNILLFEGVKFMDMIIPGRNPVKFNYQL